MGFFNKHIKKQIFHGSSTTGKDSIRILPLGGMGNVTKNMYVYEYRYDGVIKDILVVDCGIGFPDPDMYGVDLVIPDIRYLLGKQDKIRGMIFTHGHDDHIGGIAYWHGEFKKVPMWGTPLTAAFTNVKLKEARASQRVTPVDFSEVLHIGSFTVSFVRLTHSVPDTANLVIETPVGRFYHGSDFKFDFHPLDNKKSELSKINLAGQRGVLCLLSDCLGSERLGFTPSEQVVGETLTKELAHSTGKFIFSTQSSNISRVQLAIDLALEHGRKIAFIGRSIDQNVEESLRLGAMHFPREVVVRDRDLKKIPVNKQFLIVAGAQGQPGSALSRIANDAHQFIHIGEGDVVVISADPIPGNEISVNALIEQIYRRGARVSYTDIMEDLHVSGHGSQGDMMLMLTATCPSYVIPIGGTYKHMMQYRRLAAEVGVEKNSVLILEEGQIIEFIKNGPPKIVGNIDLENVMVDGLGVGDVGNAVLRDRQTIAQEGIVVVVVPIEKSTGKVTAAPDIISRGFIYMRESNGLIAKAKSVVNASLRLKKGRILDWRFVREQIEKNLAGMLSKETGRFPLIVPVIVEV